MPFTEVLVACDGSEQEATVVRLAAAVTAPTASRITLAHVVEEPAAYPEVPASAPAFEELIAMEERAWHERLAGAAAAIGGDRTVVTDVVVAPRPADALREMADGAGADLLVAGTRGLGGIQGRFLGSVSQRVLEEAPCSVLLVREDHPPPEEPVVVAGIDNDADAPDVAALAADVAAALGAELILAYVAEPLPPEGARAERYAAVRDWERALGEQALRTARGRTRDDVAVTEEIRFGRARDELVDLCMERAATLAVVGVGRHRGLAGVLLGTTSRHLAQAAPCPVLTVRPLVARD